MSELVVIEFKDKELAFGLLAGNRSPGVNHP